MDQHGHMDHATGAATRKDQPAGHGMIVLGVDTIFFYHLPMFMSPHDYQVILEGTLSQSGGDPQRTYRQDRQSNPQTRVYTLAPDPFVLTDLFPPAAKRKTISGDLFRGHFEHPPEYPAQPAKIGTSVDVQVTNVVFVQKLLPLPTPLRGLEYLLFGKGKDLFLAHLITKKGDFDQIVSVGIAGHQFLDDDLRHGIRVQLTGKANKAAEKLVAGKTVSGTAQLSNQTFSLQVAPQAEFYMSERDLV